MVERMEPDWNQVWQELIAMSRIHELAQAEAKIIDYAVGMDPIK